MPQLLSLHALDRVCAQQRKKPAYLSEKPLSLNREACVLQLEKPHGLQQRAQGLNGDPAQQKFFKNEANPAAEGG